LKGINTKVRNKSGNVLPPRCSQEISYVFGFCLKVFIESSKDKLAESVPYICLREWD